MHKELTYRQQRTIQALVLTNTIVAAARKVKVSERSIYKWMKQDHFRTVLQEARENALGHTSTRLQQISACAVDTLVGVMKDEKASAASRVSAARSSLDMVYRGRALDDIIERLHTVERRQLSQQ